MIRENEEIWDYIKEINSYSKDVVRFTKNLTFADFSKDKKTIYAILKGIEVVGEASRKIPKEFRKKHPSILWNDIVGMRDKLVHDYSGIDLDMVWKTAKVDIPKLIKELKTLL